MRRGEIWTVAHPTTPDRWMRAVVLSTDAFNETGEVYCAPILRARKGQPGAEAPPWVVELAEPDPVSGTVVLGRVARVPRISGVEQVGMLTGATLAKCAEVLRDLYEL